MEMKGITAEPMPFKNCWARTHAATGRGSLTMRRATILFSKPC